MLFFLGFLSISLLCSPAIWKEIKRHHYGKRGWRHFLLSPCVWACDQRVCPCVFHILSSNDLISSWFIHFNNLLWADDPWVTSQSPSMICTPVSKNQMSTGILTWTLLDLYNHTIYKWIHPRSPAQVHLIQVYFSHLFMPVLVSPFSWFLAWWYIRSFSDINI